MIFNYGLLRHYYSLPIRSQWDRYSALLPIPTQELERLEELQHLIAAIKRYHADSQILPMPVAEHSLAMLNGHPNQDQVNVMNDVATSLDTVNTIFALLHKSMEELAQHYHEPWQDANTLINKMLEELEESIGKALFLAEPLLFSLALRHLQAYVDKYKRENAAIYKVELEAFVRPLVVVAGKHDDRGSLSDNIYYVTLRNKGTIEAIISDLHLYFIYSGEIVLDLQPVVMDRTIKDQRVRSGGGKATV